jgi:hypothetical protein
LILAAAAAAEAAGFDAAHRLMDALNKEAPHDTLIQKYWLPVLRAQVELGSGHAQRALELLQPAATYELGDGALYSAFVRGQSYLAAGDGPAAAVEFQKILDHRGLVLNDSSGALAHLYLGRARALEARSAKDPANAKRALVEARAAYQDFLTLWKDADSDIPILRQARVEFARLENLSTNQRESRDHARLKARVTTAI